MTLKPNKFPRWELLSFLAGLPLNVLSFHLVLYRDRVWHDGAIWLESTPVIVSVSLLAWYAHGRLDRHAEQRFPDLNDSRQRILLKVVYLLVLSPLLVVFTLWMYRHWSIAGYEALPVHFLECFAIGFSISLLFRTLYEGNYIYVQYKENQAEQEMIAQLSVYQELDTLKNQINPHFLFNCFNTLSSLITVDKNQAEVFLNELSKVYRYLLRNNLEGVSTVGNEIKFIQSYFKLLQTRHGDAVRLNIQMDKQYEHYLLPSLSLQLLVENAVKHNVLSTAQPLTIDIFTTSGNKLVVNNNLQRRIIKALSNKVGLENIRAKYQLLHQPGFQIMEDDKNYTVVLPLIWSKNDSTIQEHFKARLLGNTTS
jgi:two-component system, LytTR family, sensor kinase